jgi:hypothetical protein
VSLLEFVQVDRRAFDSWAMTYAGQPSEVFEDLGFRTGFDVNQVFGERLFLKLRMMVAAASVAA